MPCLEWFDEQDAGLPRGRAPAGRQGARLRRGRPRAGLDATSSATPAASSRSSTSARPPTTSACSGVRHHRRGRRRRGDDESPRPALTADPTSRRHPSRRQRTQTDPTLRRKPMNDPLQQLSDAGVSIWLDDLSRGAWPAERLARARSSDERRRRHDQPDDLRSGAHRTATTYDEQVARARRPTAPASRRRSSRITTDDVAGALRRASRRLRPHRTASTAACRSRSSPASPTTPPAPSPRPSALWRPGRPTQRDDQDPGHGRRASRRSPPRHRERHQRQRDVDLQPRALPRGHQRLPDRARAGARPTGVDLSTIHSVASFFVSRVDTEIDKRLDAIGGAEAKALRARPASPTPGSPTEVYEQVFTSERWGSSDRPAPTRSARSGPRPRVKDPASPTRCT